MERDNFGKMNWLAIFIMPFVLHEKLLRCRRRRLRRGTEFSSLRKLRAIDPITHTRPSIFILHLASSPITDHKQYPSPGPGKHPQRRQRAEMKVQIYWVNVMHFELTNIFTALIPWADNLQLRKIQNKHTEDMSITEGEVDELSKGSPSSSHGHPGLE